MSSLPFIRILNDIQEAEGVISVDKLACSHSFFSIRFPTVPLD